VVLVARSEDKLDGVQRQISAGGGTALALPCDITDHSQVKELERKVKERFPGGPDILINNAAYVPPIHTFAGGDVSQWERAIAVNVRGALLVTRTFLPGLLEKKRGKIIFISSKAAVSPSPGLAVHGGTKAMVEAVARSLRQEVASSGVTVSVVRPGGVNTPGYSHATGHVGQDTLTGLGCWVPGDVTQCLQPSQYCRCILSKSYCSIPRCCCQLGWHFRQA